MKVTDESIKAKIKMVHYLYPQVGWDTLTLCCIELVNGYIVVGKSACVDPAMYDQKLGQRLAYEDAFRKIWPLEGYLLAETRANCEGRP